MPLREFSDIGDVRLQSRQWLDDTANVRIHQTTGERPIDRFAKTKLRPLPDGRFDFRETLCLKVYKDFVVRFEANTYTFPPWAVGKNVILKADHATVAIYHQNNKIAEHPRCYERKTRIETPAHQEQVKKLRKRMWRDQDIAVLASIGPDVVDYLSALAEARQPIRKNVARMLSLKHEYGAESLVFAILKAMKHKAYGADYIENILYQEMTPVCRHPPVTLKEEELNRIRLNESSLAEYDAYIVKKEGKHDRKSKK